MHGTYTGASSVHAVVITTLWRCTMFDSQFTTIGNVALPHCTPRPSISLILAMPWTDQALHRFTCTTASCPLVLVEWTQRSSRSAGGVDPKLQ